MSGNSLRVSAVIPAYNAADFLAEAIRSVLEQTLPCFECLVVDDGSTDGTADVAKTFPEVRVISQSNGGDARARNRGLSEAHGHYIAFLDADDIWLPHKIESQMERFRASPELGMVYSGVHLVDRAGTIIDTLLPAPGDIAFRNTLLVEKPYMTGAGSTGVVPATLVGKIGFDERLKASADWAFACRVALSYPVEAIDQPLALYRQHGDSQVHKNLGAVERDMTLVWEELFGGGLVPLELVPYRRRARANLALSLAAGYFKAGDHLRSARYLMRALLLRPDRVFWALWRRYGGTSPRWEP